MIIDARYSHVAQMLETGLRAADVQEIEAGSPFPVDVTLRRSYILSERKWVYLIDGRPHVMWGVAPAQIPGLSNAGCPWLLATEEISKHKLTLIKNTKRFVADMSRGYSRLINVVDARHTESIRWLTWAGFKVAPAPIPLGSRGMPFYIFQLET
jgi:hypothetical protein